MLRMLAAGGMMLLVVFTLTWLIQRRTRNAAIVDTVWSASFPLLALIYYIMSDGQGVRHIVLLLIVSAWGLRLAGYLLIRTLGNPEDVRYVALRTEWAAKQEILMLRFFYFQALLALVLSLPFALSMMDPRPGLTLLEICGIVLWLVAVLGESLADYQLKQFKANPSNKGKVCNEGLWYYSRHPNYFFEWLVWVAYFLIAAAAPWGWIAIYCPVIMYFLLTRVTGIAFTEAQMLKSRGEPFAIYQRTTSAFVPWFKKSEKN